MSDTFNRPMFKRGPDGRLRQTFAFGGLGALYRLGKYAAPKFTNVPYNFNAMMSRMGVPTITGKKRTTGIPNPFVGKTGPLNPTDRASYNWRHKAWGDKYNALKKKHGASGIGLLRDMPQEIKDHLSTLPKMGWRKSLAEQTGYGLAGSMAMNWMDPHEDPYADVKEEVGGMDEDNTAGTGQTGGPVASGIIPEGPKVPGTNIPDDSIAGPNDEYDGPETGITIGAAGGPIPDLTSEALAADESISIDGIDKYKNELREVIGKEDKTMGSLLLMQLGLGMMAGKSDQPGFAGFSEILGKTGQQVLPMFMQHMQNKRKEDKEIALAAYDMLREDRAAETAREYKLADWNRENQYKENWWLQQQEYKNAMNPPGDLSMIQVNSPIKLPNGEVIDNWQNIKQLYSKDPIALEIMRTGDPSLVKIVPFNLTEAGMKAAGLGDMALTKSQRGQESLLADTYKGNLSQILNFITDPELGVHSGNFHTGSAGKLISVGRFVTRDIQHAFNTLFPKSKAAANASSAIYGVLRSTTEDTMRGLVDSQSGLLAGEGNVETEAHGGQKDVQFGTYMDESGNMRDGNYATDQYVRNLMDNQFYDVQQQMFNMMGFLEARLKQPTGRLLADTIQRSIGALEGDTMLKSGDPVQYANKLHQFVRRLYEAYARHSIKAGHKPETEFGVGRLGQPLTIQGYNESYLGFTGNENIDMGISLGWLDQFPSGPETIQVGNTPGDIYPGKKEVTINAPGDFTNILNWGLTGESK